MKTDKEIQMELEKTVLDRYAGETKAVQAFATMSEEESEQDAEKQARAYIEARKNGHNRIPFEDDADGKIREQLRDWIARTNRKVRG